MRIFVLAFLLSTSAHALELPLPIEKEFVQIPDTFTANYDFEGIVKLSNCSGSLFKFEGAADTDPGLVLTNGHCLGGSGFLQPGQFVYQKAVTRSFGLLKPNGQSVAGNVSGNRVEYATMTMSDMAIYRLNETYAQIQSEYNIRPLILSPRHTIEGTAMDVISGYWKKGYSCYVEKFIHMLKEDAWTWKDSIRYSRPGCETIHGTSGSPVIDSNTRMIIGINNTGNDDGQKCTMNNPCEVDEHGNIVYEMGVSYGQQTYWLYSCLNEKNQIDLSVEGCVLPH